MLAVSLLCHTPARAAINFSLCVLERNQLGQNTVVSMSDTQITDPYHVTSIT